MASVEVCLIYQIFEQHAGTEMLTERVVAEQDVVTAHVTEHRIWQCSMGAG
jgi:hypothetical protein